MHNCHIISGGAKRAIPTRVSMEETSTGGKHINMHADDSGISSQSVGALIADNSQLYSSIPGDKELGAVTNEQTPEQKTTANIYDLPIDPQ